MAPVPRSHVLSLLRNIFRLLHIMRNYDNSIIVFPFGRKDYPAAVSGRFSAYEKQPKKYLYIFIMPLVISTVPC